MHNCNKNSMVYRW